MENRDDMRHYLEKLLDVHLSHLARAGANPLASQIVANRLKIYTITGSTHLWINAFTRELVFYELPEFKD